MKFTDVLPSRVTASTTHMNAKRHDFKKPIRFDHLIRLSLKYLKVLFRQPFPS